MNKKRIAGAALASALLIAPLSVQTANVMADSFYTNQTNAERADITNWVANSTQAISSNISAQHIDPNNPQGGKYIIQWGDTLSGISAATGISVRKLAYDNHIHNIDLIYAGDILILNRDGEVPTDWDYEGTGIYVAKTKITINNFIDNSDNSININISPVSEATLNEQAKITNNFGSDVDNGGKSQSKDTGSDDTSSKTTKKDKSKSDSESTSDEMDESEFSDTVKSEVASKLNLDSDKLDIDFTTDGSDNSTDTDSDTTNVYSSDQSISTGSDKLTEKNAKALADKIASQLQSEGKTDDIDKADQVELVVTADGDGFKFNVALTTSDDSDKDSDSSSDEDTNSESDSDKKSSDDEDTNSDEKSNDDEDTNSESDADKQSTDDADTNSDSDQASNDEDTNKQSDKDTNSDEDKASSDDESSNSDQNSNNQADSNSDAESDSQE